MWRIESFENFQKIIISWYDLLLVLTRPDILSEHTSLTARIYIEGFIMKLTL